MDIRFATQLGGGPDINRALAYDQGLVTRPAHTVFVLISDQIEGGRREECVARMAALAIERRDLGRWAPEQGTTTAAPTGR